MNSRKSPFIKLGPKLWVLEQLQVAFYNISKKFLNQLKRKQMFSKLKHLFRRRKIENRLNILTVPLVWNDPLRTLRVVNLFLSITELSLLNYYQRTVISIFPDYLTWIIQYSCYLQTWWIKYQQFNPPRAARKKVMFIWFLSLRVFTIF